MHSLRFAMIAARAVSTILYGALPGFLGYLTVYKTYQNEPLAWVAFLITAFIAGHFIDKWIDESNKRIRDERAARAHRMEADRMRETNSDLS